MGSGRVGSGRVGWRWWGVCVVVVVEGGGRGGGDGAIDFTTLVSNKLLKRSVLQPCQKQLQTHSTFYISKLNAAIFNDFVTFTRSMLLKPLVPTTLFLELLYYIYIYIYIYLFIYIYILIYIFIYLCISI